MNYICWSMQDQVVIIQCRIELIPFIKFLWFFSSIRMKIKLSMDSRSYHVWFWLQVFSFHAREVCAEIIIIERAIKIMQLVMQVTFCNKFFFKKHFKIFTLRSWLHDLFHNIMSIILVSMLIWSKYNMLLQECHVFKYHHYLQG